MPLIESIPSISVPLREAVSTGVEIGVPVTRDYGRQDRAPEKWQNMIDYQLIEWGRNPSQLEHEDIQPPSTDTILRAIRLANMLWKRGLPEPTRIVPDAHGGIVFERHEGNVFESIRLSADGSSEYCAFEGSRLVERQPWVL